MKKKAKDVLPLYNLDAWNVDPNCDLEIMVMDAKKLLVPERLDIICKLVYIDRKNKNLNFDFAKSMYIEHIRAFSGGTFREPGNKDKEGIDKYLKVFDELIENLPKEGFDTTVSVVGMTKSGKILDGSHRTAISIYYKIPISVVYIQEQEHYNFNYLFFLRNGMPRYMVEYLVYNYVLLSQDTFVLCLWPSADDESKKKIAENYIIERSSIVYKKDIRLNYHGLFHLMIHAYGNGRLVDKWAGNEQNGFSGIHGKANSCYMENHVTTVYILTKTTLNDMSELKKKIRELFQISNHSVHITDTHDEAVTIAQVVLNENSIDLLNNGEPFRYHGFVQKVTYYRQLLLKNKCSFDDYALDSSAVLSLYGLREANDIDYLTVSNIDLPKDDLIENHKGILQFHIHSCEELICNPQNYLYYRGLKYISLENVRAMKNRRWNLDRDIKDIKLIRRLIYRRIKRMPACWRIDYLKQLIKKRLTDKAFFKFSLGVYRFLKFNVFKKAP